MIRTYPDGTVYESDLTDIELRHPDNAVAMELVETLRTVSRTLQDHVHGTNVDEEVDDLECAVAELEAENEGLTKQVEKLKKKLAAMEAAAK